MTLHGTNQLQNNEKGIGTKKSTRKEVDIEVIWRMFRVNEKNTILIFAILIALRLKPGRNPESYNRPLAFWANS
jgi:hypothetical protein